MSICTAKNTQIMRILIFTSFLSLVSASSEASIVYVSNTNNNTIERFNENGVGSTFAITTSSPRGLALDAVGNLYVAYPLLNSVQKFSPSGVDLGSFISSGLNSPEGLAFDGGGNLYVSNLGDDTIRRYTSAGFDLGNFASTGLSDPYGIAFDGSGNLYASEGNSGNMRKIDPFGASVFFGGPGQFGVAIDSAGNVYAATGNLKITKTTPSGFTSVFATTAADPFGLAFDDVGTLYATFITTNSIERFAADGTSLGTFVTAGLSSPTHITVQIPEPSTVTLLLAGAAFINRRRLHHAK
jgi:sugar lactone lactonase YvrE